LGIEHRNLLDFHLEQKKSSELSLSIVLDELLEIHELCEINEALETETLPGETIASPHISLSPSKLSFYSITARENSTPENNFKHRSYSR